MREDIIKYIKLIKEKIYDSYSGMFREEGGALKYKFITPGSEQYDDVLWDWDSWLSNIALKQILIETNNKEEIEKARLYEEGCILNFLTFGSYDGWLPIAIDRHADIKKIRPSYIYDHNMHKPVLAQHAAFLIGNNGGEVEWLREKFYFLQAFVNNYRNHHKHKSGLYYWQTDHSIGIDNDPCTFYRPNKSSGSIYLNCLMYKEFKAMAYLAECLNLGNVGKDYDKDAEDLKKAIIDNCWDERDGYFYSVDLNLLPINHNEGIHMGQPRDWECIIQRIGIWSGFLALWAGIATPEQAKRMVIEHFGNEKTFSAPFGVRTLSKMEKMYNLRATGNPSNWLGPIWGISNYMTFRGLVNYGYLNEAQELAEKTILLFGKDFERSGALHEYYQPENGEPLLNKGFQNWNFLVINMIAWLEGKRVLAEF